VTDWDLATGIEALGSLPWSCWFDAMGGILLAPGDAATNTLFDADLGCPPERAFGLGPIVWRRP